MKPYVGVTSKIPEKRFREHEKQARSGKETHLYRAIRKYGIDSFEIVPLDTAKTEEKAYELEEEWIERLGTYKHGYNMTRGGDRGPTMKGSENPIYGRNRENMPTYGKTGKDHHMYGRTGEDHPMYNRSHSEEAKRKMSEAQGGLSPKEAAEVKYLSLGGSLTQREIGKKYGISKAAVSYIKNGDRWSHIEPQKPDE